MSLLCDSRLGNENISIEPLEPKANCDGWIGVLIIPVVLCTGSGGRIGADTRLLGWRSLLSIKSGKTRARAWSWRGWTGPWHMCERTDFSWPVIGHKIFFSAISLVNSLSRTRAWYIWRALLYNGWRLRLRLGLWGMETTRANEKCEWFYGKLRFWFWAWLWLLIDSYGCWYFR